MPRVGLTLEFDHVLLARCRDGTPGTHSPIFVAKVCTPVLMRSVLLCYCTYVFSYGKAVEMKFLGSLKLPVYQLPLLGRLSVEYSMTPFKSCSFLKMIKKLVEIFGLYCKHTSCRSFKNWYAVNIVNRQIPISLCPGRTYVTLTVIDLGSILLNF